MENNFKVIVDAILNSDSVKEIKDKLSKTKLGIDVGIETKKMATDLQRISQANIIKTWMEGNTKATKKFGVELDAMISKLRLEDNISRDDFNKIKSHFKEIQLQARQTGNIGMTAGDKLKKAWEKFGGWSIATTALVKGFQELKKGVRFVVDLDTAMTNINYTMDVTPQKLGEIGNKSLKMAKALNTSAQNVLAAVTTYANANETADSILRKSKPTIMLSNVTGMDTATTTDILQGSINQFDLEDTEESLYRISDILQSVSQSMPVDFAKGIKEMADGIQASGSVAKDAGYDIEHYSALLGNLIAKTRQSGSELARSLRTMMVRTTKASTSALAGGEVTEDDLSNAETALRRVGIEIRNDIDDFRDFDDIMNELASKIDSLSEVDLSNIAYEVASTRQTATFKNMIKYWSDYQDLAKKAESAGDVTLQNQEKYAKSLKGSLSELSATAESLWNNVFKSDTLKSGIDLLTGLLGVINKLSDKLGVIPTLGLGAGLFAGIKNVGGEKMLSLLF